MSAAALLAAYTVPAWSAEPVRPPDLVESVAFLEAYRAASASHDASFYDLYSDRALVHIRVRAEDPAVVFDGRAFKRWGRELLQTGRISLDGSVFRDATVEQHGSRLLIRAKRYSTTRCYWDEAYQMTLERETVSYRIIEERLTSNLTSHCRESAPLLAAASIAPALAASVAETSPDLAAPPAPAWHPLSEVELADQALRIAQQMAATQAAAAASQPTGANPGLTATPSVPVGNGAFVAPAERGDESALMRITPPEAP